MHPICSLIIIIMPNAFDTILNTYDLEQCKEIANHGCQSGVCSQHIYYVDTIEFFDTYTDEITEYIVDNIGVDHLSDTLKKNTGNLDMYKNDLAWTFIELVAMHRVDCAEEQELKDEETIGNYMKEETSDNGYTLSDPNLKELSEEGRRHGYVLIS